MPANNLFYRDDYLISTNLYSSLFHIIGFSPTTGGLLFLEILPLKREKCSLIPTCKISVLQTLRHNQILSSVVSEYPRAVLDF